MKGSICVSALNTKDTRQSKPRPRLLKPTIVISKFKHQKELWDIRVDARCFYINEDDGSVWTASPVGRLPRYTQMSLYEGEVLRASLTAEERDTLDTNGKVLIYRNDRKRSYMYVTIPFLCFLLGYMMGNM